MAREKATAEREAEEDVEKEGRRTEGGEGQRGSGQIHILFPRFFLKKEKEYFGIPRFVFCYFNVN